MVLSTPIIFFMCNDAEDGNCRKLTIHVTMGSVLQNTVLSQTIDFVLAWG